MATITMTGGPELERALKELGGQVAGRLGANAVRAGGREIVKAAKARVPVGETGKLKRSIRVFSRTKRRGSTVEIEVGSDVFYGRFLEFGTSRQAARPWLRPAIDESAQAAVDKLVDNLGKGIAREVAKYKGK